MTSRYMKRWAGVPYIYRIVKGHGMDTETYIFIAIFFVILTLVALVQQQFKLAAKKRELNDKLTSLPNFTPTQSLFNILYTEGIAIDEERKKLAFLTMKSFVGIKIKTYEYRDILSSEVILDGESETKTKRTSQVGGALLGGLLLGGVGVVVGGLSGKSRTSEIIKELKLRITVNDTSNPIFEINSHLTKSTKFGRNFKNHLSDFEKWHGILSSVIAYADKLDAEQEPPAVEIPNISSKTSTSASRYKDLERIAKLKESGILTEEEFLTEKNRILLS